MLFLCWGLFCFQEEIVIPTARPAEEFYLAAGRGISLRFSLESTELTTLDWVPLTLTLEKVQNPEAMQVPDLRLIADFRDRFDFRDGLPSKQISGDRCVLVYTIRPRDATVTDVPPLRFRYYLVGSETGNLKLDFPLTVSPAIPIRVKPPAEPIYSVQPIDPESLSKPLTETERELLLAKRNGSTIPLLFWFVPPLLAILWIAFSRWRNPTEARLARLRQSRAARRAIEQLHEVEEMDSRVRIFREYLGERFQVPSTATTPSEILAALEPLGFTTLNGVRESLEAQDRLRFSSAAGEKNASIFVDLILQLEEAAA
jgi:hypothetical protein